MNHFYVTFQNFDTELARVGEAPTLEIATQIALAVYAKPPTSAQCGIPGQTIPGPAVAVYKRATTGSGNPGLSRSTTELVLWIGLNATPAAQRAA